MGCPPSRGKGWDRRPAGEVAGKGKDLVGDLGPLAECNLEGLRRALSLDRERNNVPGSRPKRRSRSEFWGVIS